MLNEEQIEQNKQDFLEIVDSIKIEGADIEGLKNFLLESDFFTAPASTIYHAGYKGGLCQHSLNVYENLVKLVREYFSHVECKDEGNGSGYEEVVMDIPLDSLKVVALFHDISKTNFYELSSKNTKVYSDKGSKSDSLGKFDWFSEESYKVKDVKERFVGADHGTNSYLILSRYVPLTEEEIIAIINHHCHTNDGQILQDQSAIMNRFPLLTLLHLADMISTFINERL